MITGGVKFFSSNFALYKNGATATASSNDAGAKNALSFFQYTVWESVASDDLTVEELLIDLGALKVIDRLFLINMNFKSFDVMYQSGVSYVHFSDVVGINGEVKTNITETTYALDSAYYEVAPVTARYLRIRITTSQVVDAQKYITTFVATKELGTFNGFPKVIPTSDRNEVKTKTLSNKVSVQKTLPNTDISMRFNRYPDADDLALLELLFDREDPFLVWLCGGRVGSDYFKFNQVGWRIRDLFNMQLTGSFSNEFHDGIYKLGFNKNLKFEEHV